MHHKETPTSAKLAENIIDHCPDLLGVSDPRQKCCDGNILLNLDQGHQNTTRRPVEVEQILTEAVAHGTGTGTAEVCGQMRQISN